MKLRKVGLKLYLYVFYIRTEISCRAFSPQLFTSLEQVVNHLVTRSNSLTTSCSNKFDIREFTTRPALLRGLNFRPGMPASNFIKVINV